MFTIPRCQGSRGSRSQYQHLQYQGSRVSRSQFRGGGMAREVSPFPPEPAQATRRRPKLPALRRAEPSSPATPISRVREQPGGEGGFGPTGRAGETKVEPNTGLGSRERSRAHGSRYQTQPSNTESSPFCLVSPQNRCGTNDAGQGQTM